MHARTRCDITYADRTAVDDSGCSPIENLPVVNIMVQFYLPKNTEHENILCAVTASSEKQNENILPEGNLTRAVNARAADTDDLARFVGGSPYSVVN